ncbi:hypothetical protein [Streptomyces sedi]|uniref:DUF892 family protein n=1 Tax=Streptomyces sedi TaxID=555059 RepID=A0A5C4VET7_9ACTN|nr:hypothetical protein [Streptomyces sedi]TNM33549.1 hypothetical protein FH715_04135 [Streptomyces sedi]
MADSHPDPGRALTVYLNDHLAGATAGVALARRLARHRPASGTAGELAALAAEVRDDRARLRALMRELGVPSRRSLALGAALAERLGRLKPNGRLLRTAEARDVVELEAMLLGVQGKAALWRALAVLPRIAATGRAAEVRMLLTRAERQTHLLERLRTEATRRTLSTPEPTR